MRRAIFMLAIVLATLVDWAPPAQSAPADDERTFYELTNSARAANGLGALQYDVLSANVARTWSTVMATTGVLAHNPSLTLQLDTLVTASWTRYGENVGYGLGIDVPALHQAFMDSSGHRSNILGPFNRVGVGAVRSGDLLWVTVIFLNGPSIPYATPPPAAPPPVLDWYLRNALSGGAPDGAAAYGMDGYIPVVGDWDGNGTDTPGVYVNGWWYLRNSMPPGPPDITVHYGGAGYQPVVGDWDANGTDTVGVYDANGWWLLRNTNSGGPGQLVAHYGGGAAQPVVGDWDANGTDTIGVYDGGWWLLRSSVSGGAPQIVVNYGAAGYQAVVGDWDGNGTDTIGVYVSGWWYLRQIMLGGKPDITVNYGAAGYRAFAGDWNADGRDGMGVTT